MSWNVIVIGAGAMAQGYDEPSSPLVLTHVKGYRNDRRFEIVGICDADASRARMAAQKWQIPAWGGDYSELNARADVVSICSPDHTHGTLLLQVLERKPSLVFCEKPLARDSGQAERIVEAYEKANVALAVNYTRRWIPEVRTLRQQIRDGRFGRIVSARVKYYKGFLHNGSHAIDALLFLLEPDFLEGIVTREILDYTAEDPTISGACVLQAGESEFPLTLEGYDGRKMALFEIEMVFEKARLLLEDTDRAWLTMARLRQNDRYPGFFEFSDIDRTQMRSEQAMANAIDNIAASLSEGKPLASTGASALETLRLCVRMRDLPRLRQTEQSTKGR